MWLWPNEYEIQRNIRDEFGRISDEEARSAAGELAFAAATAERPVGAAEPVAASAPGSGARRNRSRATRGQGGNKVILWQKQTINQTAERRRPRKCRRRIAARARREPARSFPAG